MDRWLFNIKGSIRWYEMLSNWRSWGRYIGCVVYRIDSYDEWRYKKIVYRVCEMIILSGR